MSVTELLSRSICMSLRKVLSLVAMLAFCTLHGCGSQGAVMPEGSITEEQREQIKAEDEAVMEEESAGE